MQRPDSLWRSGCRALAEAQAALDLSNPEPVRDCLAQLDAAMRDAPWNIRTIYAEFPEAELEEATRTQAAAILGGGKAWACGLVQTRQCLLALAIQIRSLDHILHGMDTRYARVPSDPMREWLCKSGNAFVIPARRRRDLGSTAGDKLSYGRRGTRYYRIIPTALQKVPVRIVALAAADLSSVKDNVTLGGAIFPGLQVKTRKTPNGFRVQRVEHPDINGCIKSQAESMSRAHAIVWPELTIDDKALATLTDHLAVLSLAQDAVPNVIIAGSWHRKVNGRIRNSAPILTGQGEEKGQHSKIVRFADDANRFEDIECGDEIIVLVCDRFLASVAICKDYCNLGEAPPWLDLDVDFLLVPSMGKTTTMDGHINRAKTDRITHGLRAFVVQQGLAGKAGDAEGFILLAPQESTKDTCVDKEWNLFEA